MSLNFYCNEEEESNKDESINKYKFLFSNYEKKIPTLSEALIQMYKSLNLNDKLINELTKEIIEKCKERIDPLFKEIKMNYDNITKEDAYIICSYTYESQFQKFSPYKILNINLVSDDRKNGVKNVSKYLYILLKSLRKLPRYYPKNKYLYRCLTCLVNISPESNKNKNLSYIEGNTKTFWGFTSTSPDKKTTYTFLNKEENTKTGTIFLLKGDIWGYNIELFNYFKEKEILLEPERKFVIENVMPPLNNVIYITCNILNSDLILTDNEKGTNLVSHNKIEICDEINSNISDFIVKFEMEAIINNENRYTSGIGVLCNIPSKNMKALITFSHMINLDFLNEGEKILLYINKKEIYINIKLDRYKDTDEDLDFTIIEILEIDNIKNFIEIDKFINSRNYTDSTIIYISLNSNENFYDLIYGKIIEKKEEHYIYDIESKKEGIILLKDNMKLIGILRKNKNKGEADILPVKIIINNINCIRCIYIIKKEDIDKDIKILNNEMNIGDRKDINISDKTFEKISNGNFYMNSINKEIKVIINGKIQHNMFTYKFSREGNYVIYLLFYNILNNTSFMFGDCNSIYELNFKSFNINQVTDMSCMFFNCSLLKELQFKSLITNQVTNMSCMFLGCKLLEKLDLSSFNTNQVADMSCLFFGCSSLKEINLSSFNTNQVNDMSGMFGLCSSLCELDLSSINTNQVTDMSGMFINCSLIKELNLSLFSTNEVTDMSYMFLGCKSLEKLDLSSFITNQVTNMSCMFFSCSSLKQLNLLSFNTNKVNNMSSMFSSCSSLKELNLSSFNTNQVTNMSSMFFSCFSLKELNLSSFNTDKVINSSGMFNFCSSLKKLDLSSFNFNQITNKNDMFALINKSCKIKCSDKKIQKEFNNSIDCIII